VVRVKVKDGKDLGDSQAVDTLNQPDDNTELQAEIEDKEDKNEDKKEKPFDKMSKTELLEKVNELKKTSEKNTDLYLRTQAEIENLKKRAQRDKEDWIKFSNESLIKQLLPVMDNLENAIAHSKDENNLDALIEGVNLTLKGLNDTLEKGGLVSIEAEGKPFDPNFHEAVSEQENNEVDSGTVILELQKGYLLNERLIRPAMVVVSKKNSKND
jgi:molecular chaperone GrpE